jgi:hypothetical protein
MKMVSLVEALARKNDEARESLDFGTEPPSTAGLAILAATLTSDVRSFLDTAPYVASRAAGKALDTTKETTLILTEAGREGIFNRKVGDFSAEVAADTAEAIYFDAGDGSTGAWVRVFDGIVDFRWAGAVANGIGNDKPAVDAAIALGLPLTGSGMTYGVSGKISPLENTRIWDAEFKQLAPGASLDVITLHVDGVNNVDLRRVKVNRNGDGTNGGFLNGSPGNNGALDEAYGILVDGGSGHYLADLEVYGDDSGSLISFQNLGDSCRIIRPHARDAKWVRTAATDDQLQGIFIYNCADLEIVSPRVTNLTGILNGVASKRFTRAIPIGASKRIRISFPYIEDTDQGVDLTGSVGSFRRTYTYPVKFANTARRNVAQRCIGYDCGAAFVASGNSAYAPELRTADNSFIDCVNINCGASGQAVVAASAFYALGFGAGTSEEINAARTKFIRCKALDFQAVKTMVYGFQSNAPQSTASMMEDCEVVGNTASTPTGGIFTGVVVKSENVTNGRYIKYDDGTLEVTTSIDVSSVAITTAAGALFVSAAQTWTFPTEVPFIAEPIVTPIYLRNDGAVAGGVYQRIGSATVFTYGLWASASVGAGNTKLVKFHAIGRWK